MQERSQIAAAIAAILLVSCPAGLALAQNAPAAGTDTATPPAASAPAATTPAPAAAPATTTPAPAASAPPPAASPSTAKDSGTAPAKETKKKKMTRQQEIDHSIATGTVPSRYRSSVPKAYQKYIPFDKK